jgi:hypothetical protein
MIMSDRNNFEKREYKALVKYYKKNLQDQQDEDNEKDDQYHKVAKKRQSKYNDRLLRP